MGPAMYATSSSTRQSTTPTVAKTTTSVVVVTCAVVDETCAFICRSGSSARCLLAKTSTTKDGRRVVSDANSDRVVTTQSVPFASAYEKTPFESRSCAARAGSTSATVRNWPVAAS